MRKLRDRSHRRAIGMLAVAALASALALAIRAGGHLAWVESRAVDARFSLRDEREAAPGVLIVGIDNDTLGHLPRFPFSRSLYAPVIESLHRAAARVIAFDIAFDQPTTNTADLALFEAARRAAPVIFATSLITAAGQTEVLGGNENLAGIGARPAASDLLADSDGEIRHLLGQVHHLPTLAVAAATTALGHPVDARLLAHSWIDFRGPPGSVREVSFLDVLHGKLNRREVAGRTVVIGTTAPVLQDIHATAVGARMAGPEVQAQAISTILSGFPLRSAPNADTTLLIVLLGILVPLAGILLGSLGTAVFSLAVLCLWSLASQIAFDKGTVLDFSDPAAALVLSTAGTFTLAAWSERRERRELRELFAADSTAVVDQVLGPAPSALAPTSIIGGYKLEEAIGRGGMGVVYRATQTELDRTVAIKLIATERTADPVYRERFKQESRLAASIDHANVVPVYEAGEDDGLLFIAMRLVDGVDLAQLIAHSGALDPARALRILEQLAGALDAAHAKGLVHRDVKPANVLITSEQPEHVYLTDFGVAKSIGAGAAITRAEQLVGTLDYISPEQIQGLTAGTAVDVYALTGLFHHCLTGQVPYPREEEPAKLWAHLNAPPPCPSHLDDALPSELDAVIARGMQKEPAQRYPSAGDLARAAAHVLGLPSRLPSRESPRPDESNRPDSAAATVAPGEATNSERPDDLKTLPA
ncbi:MAG: CHASE2 domain-containing serine/threonine-protein kinase [Solirubrobacteraceae bacterium]